MIFSIVGESQKYFCSLAKIILAWLIVRLFLMSLVERFDEANYYHVKLLIWIGLLAFIAFDVFGYINFIYICIGVVSVIFESHRY